MNTALLRFLAVIAAALFLATASGPARADSDGFGGIEVASERELDAVRGGFSTGDGLLVSFGIEKAVYVNGILQATSTWNLLDPARNPLSLVQIGPGNTAAIEPGDIVSGSLTVVQNSLDQQLIQNITKISATVNSVSLIRELNFSAGLTRSLILSGR